MISQEGHGVEAGVISHYSQILHPYLSFSCQIS